MRVLVFFFFSSAFLYVYYHRMCNLLYKYSQQADSSTYRLTHAQSLAYAMACAAHARNLPFVPSYTFSAFYQFIFHTQTQVRTYLLHIVRLLGGFDGIIEISFDLRKPASSRMHFTCFSFSCQIFCNSINSASLFASRLFEPEVEAIFVGCL